MLKRIMPQDSALPSSIISFPSRKSQAYERSTEALSRKRDRDRNSQRRKREREREYIRELESKVHDLEGRLAEATTRFRLSNINHVGVIGNLSATDATKISTLSLPSVPLLCASLRTPGNDHTSHIRAVTPSPEASESYNREIARPLLSRVTAIEPPLNLRHGNVTVSSTVLINLLSTPEWSRIPLWNISRPSSNYRFLERGGKFPALLSQLRSDSSMEMKCPPFPKAIDLLFGGSSNLLANFIFADLSGMPLLSPEKFASCWLIYMYFRVCDPDSSAHPSSSSHTK
jgi:hypothetical protein